MTISINKKTLNIIGISLLVILGLFGLQLLMTQAKDNADVNGANSQKTQTATKEQKDIDKIQVIKFHTTHQCWSCVTLGDYAKKTITERFPQEYKSGKIEFLEIDIDLPENKEMANLFGASGSSLYINTIINGQNNIEEEIQVWQLLSNEENYKNYLENKLNEILY